ncbi:MAG: hypothetical protein KatS3mg031_0695 [Chitinophagales bacterium]|nr:MAG: hypothetical protein KatS3mg031_0695 [Chitinophagales bacterium]
MKTPYCIFLLFIVGSFAGCDAYKSLSPRGKLMIKNKETLFRGVHFDSSISTVKALEEITPELEYNDYLRYNISADSIAAGESLEVEYFFNKKDQLDMIIAFYYVTNKNAIKPLTEELRRYFEQKIGPARRDESGAYHWELPDEQGLKGTIEINLTGETEEGYMGVELELIKYYEYERRL